MAGGCGHLKQTRAEEIEILPYPCSRQQEGNNRNNLFVFPADTFHDARTILLPSGSFNISEDLEEDCGHSRGSTSALFIAGVPLTSSSSSPTAARTKAKLQRTSKKSTRTHAVPLYGWNEKHAPAASFRA